MHARVPSMLDALYSEAQRRNWPIDSLSGYRMEEPPTPPATPPAEPPAPATPPTPPAPPATPPANETPEQTIARLEAEVKAARGEAGKERVNAKKAAADEARAELAQQIGKALGLVPDETIDPEKLTEQVSASQAEARQSKIELAVFRAAETANGDPIALLDSRAFLEKVGAIEPTDTAALVAAITEAVTENPRLGKTAPAAGGMRPNPAQGSSANQPLGIDAQIAAAEQAGDLKATIRLKAAKSISQQ